VPSAGLEPATYRLGRDRSIQMSYEGLNSIVPDLAPRPHATGVLRTLRL
jgi:hypothetical protein